MSETPPHQLVAERDAGLAEIERNPDRLNHWRNAWGGAKEHVIFRSGSGDVAFDQDIAEDLWLDTLRESPGPWRERKAVAIVRGRRLAMPQESANPYAIKIDLGERRESWIKAEQFARDPRSGARFGLTTEIL